MESICDIETRPSSIIGIIVQLIHLVCLHHHPRPTLSQFVPHSYVHSVTTTTTIIIIENPTLSQSPSGPGPGPSLG